MNRKADYTYCDTSSAPAPGASARRSGIAAELNFLSLEAAAFERLACGVRAAATGTPAVVIYGGVISPANTGYDLHLNQYAGGEPCGSRKPCRHCRQAMGAIGVPRVVADLRRLLAARGVACAT